MPKPHPLAGHRAHDYRHLLARWRAVARAAGTRLRVWHQQDGFPLCALITPALRKSGGLYLSAGIHGDEPAGTEALLAWAETQGAKLRDLPALLIPCLNPWGLKNNTRTDATGRDLNRLFGQRRVPFIRAWRALLDGRQFDLSLLLHEDFDAQGIYVYEIQRVEPYWGELLLLDAAKLLPIETRRTIDGRRFKAGVFRRDIRRLKVPWLAEAMYLHFHHSARNFTIETPSEFALQDRVAAQVRMVRKAIQLNAAASADSNRS